MRRVYLTRHAEKEDGPHGVLTKAGEEAAVAAGKSLPRFARVMASPSEHTQLTAALMTGRQPEVRDEADFYMATPEKSAALAALAQRQGTPFPQAVNELGDPEVLKGVDAQAKALNTLIQTLLDNMHPNEAALIVSHDMSITPAMAQRGLPFAPIAFLSGYIIQEDGQVTEQKPLA